MLSSITAIANEGPEYSSCDQNCHEQLTLLGNVKLPEFGHIQQFPKQKGTVLYCDALLPTWSVLHSVHPVKRYDSRSWGGGTSFQMVFLHHKIEDVRLLSTPTSGCATAQPAIPGRIISGAPSHSNRRIE